MLRSLICFLSGILLFLGLSGVASAQSFTGDVTLSNPSPGTVTGNVSGTVNVSGTSYFVQGGAICTITRTGVTCKPITKVPEINADSGKLALAFVAVIVLLSAELMRRRRS
jgi:hypothetical protein